MCRVRRAGLSEATDCCFARIGSIITASLHSSSDSEASPSCTYEVDRDLVSSTMAEEAEAPRVRCCTAGVVQRYRWKRISPHDAENLSS